MYERFYELNARPFLTVPDPSFLFWSEGHELGYTMLRYGVETRSLITVITGEIGAGKTTLLRHLMDDLPEDVTMGLISNMQEGRGDLLHWAMMSLDQDFGDEPYVKLFKRFQDYVIDRYAEGRRVMLVIDEAQNLSVKQLEELRMLSNINADRDELLQIILVGQPQLRDLLARPDLAQFAQRIAADFHLPRLSAEDTARYVNHRLQVSGARWEIFPPKTCDLIYEATGGVPRLVNILCDLALVYGYSGERTVIEEDLLWEFLSSIRRHGIYTHLASRGSLPKLVASVDEKGEETARSGRAGPLDGAGF
ncbi:MAG: AAA family ATPase [Pseudomonadota bacterium]